MDIVSGCSNVDSEFTSRPSAEVFRVCVVSAQQVDPEFWRGVANSVSVPRRELKSLHVIPIPGSADYAKIMPFGGFLGAKAA